MSSEVARKTADNGGLFVVSDPTAPLLDQVRILGEREGGLTECYIPTELIDHEEVPVKEEWAASIAAQMREIAEKEGGSGQQSPIQVGQIEGEDKFRIIDGFHRDAALLQNGATHIYCTVRPTDWNTLYDSRIFTAKDHVHVRFSRVVQWIREVWAHSDLADKMTVEQAVLLYRFDTDGSKSGLNPEDVASAKSWVERKESQWDMAAMTIHGHLKIAESVAPELVHSTREKKSGRELEAPTQAILKIFSGALPNSFELQNLVMAAAMRNNLKGPQVKALCDKVCGQEPKAAQGIIEDINWDTWEPAFSESTGRQLRRASDPRYKGAAALLGASKEITRVLERVRQSRARGEEVTDEMKVRLGETARQAKALRADLGILALELSSFISQGESGDTTRPAVAEKRTHRATPQPELSTAIRQRNKKGDGNEDRPSPKSNLQPRPRNRYVAVELPSFGKLTNEDWGTLEPHHRFALSLDHADITEGTFESTVDIIKRALETALLTPEGEGELSREDVVRIVKPLTALLTKPVSKVGDIVVFNRTTKKLEISDIGRKYLANVVTEALLEVDASRDDGHRPKSIIKN